MRLRGDSETRASQDETLIGVSHLKSFYPFYPDSSLPLLGAVRITRNGTRIYLRNCAIKVAGKEWNFL